MPSEEQVGYFKGVLVFLLLLVFLPFIVVFLLKLLVVAGTWTLESITQPLYAIAAGVTFLAVLALGIWVLIASSAGSSRVASPANKPGRATAYCNACGTLNWADATNCHSCRAKMT